MGPTGKFFIFKVGLTGKSAKSEKVQPLNVYPFTLRCTGTPPCFPAMFSKDDIFVTSCLLTWRTKASPKGSSLKEKNLLRREQILSFMR